MRVCVFRLIVLNPAELFASFNLFQRCSWAYHEACKQAECVNDRAADNGRPKE